MPTNIEKVDLSREEQPAGEPWIHAQVMMLLTLSPIDNPDVLPDRVQIRKLRALVFFPCPVAVAFQHISSEDHAIACNNAL